VYTVNYKEFTMFKKILLAAMIAGSIGSVALPASAAVIIVREAPPPPRDEVMPAPRHGYTWASGHWEWRNNKHQWVRGTWIRDRKGYVYHGPTWQEHDGRWQMSKGAWIRGQQDDDHDGVKNKDDHRPNNPNRS
jgi:hypothetical protein